MEIFKKLLLFAAVTIVVLFLGIWSLNAFGFRSPVFAFLVNWLAMSWVAVAGQAADFTFPARYYDLQSFESSGRVYEHLGIRLFKALVRRGPLSVFSPTLRFPKEKTITALRHLDHEMRKAETGHAVLFVLMGLLTSYALIRGWFDAAGWLLVFNVFINAYPVMLQRYNRIKLQELIGKQAV